MHPKNINELIEKRESNKQEKGKRFAVQNTENQREKYPVTRIQFEIRINEPKREILYTIAATST
jgi:hypothetical protein